MQSCSQVTYGAFQEEYLSQQGEEREVSLYGLILANNSDIMETCKSTEF